MRLPPRAVRAAGGILMLLAAGALAAPRKPNILLVVVDDLGYGELGCQGNAEIPTPHIDSIAANGVRFTNGYVSAPVCCPSRAGFLTGRYQTRFGHEHNAIGAQNRKAGIGLPLKEKTLADLLKKRGYATGLVGKWHLGATKPYHPLNRGFDEFYGFLHEGHFYAEPPYRGMLTWFRVNSLPEGVTGTRARRGDRIFSTHMGYTEPMYDRGNPVMRGFDQVEEPEYLTDALAREAVSFIGRHAKEPFFLYLAYNAPHSPLQAPLDAVEAMGGIDDIQRRLFAGMVSRLDDSIGRVLAAVRSQALERDTLLIFFSDNGGPTAELTSSNLPLRGGKGDLYEGGIRVPFLVQWTGSIPSGTVYGKPVIALDSVPTALAAAGARTPEGLDGVNLLPYLRGDKEGAPHDLLFWRYGKKTALQSGKWKIVRNPGRGEETAQWELYDLSVDISEKQDLATERPQILERLRLEVQRQNARMIPPLWVSEGSGAEEDWPLRIDESHAPVN